ncbi:hypothetical protein PPO43_15955 [Saprospira sp. CCB-QB6]|uniref:hypothetical protein n=1 Tax=Saprospira sp. CCB-QB6 TaxID=3023936 RepID=UPI00234A26CD|nr:hypothetical protein [Saprospira sp. CCB-QB6]WCL81468.1 hypothetical protein PPO43_15955 [Saprospira sp. CCB-QB6]
MKSLICSFLLLFLGLQLQAQDIYYPDLAAFLNNEGQKISKIKKAKFINIYEDFFQYEVNAQLENGDEVKSLWNFQGPSFIKRDGDVYCLKRTRMGTYGSTYVYQDDIYKLKTVGNFFYFRQPSQGHLFLEEFKTKYQYRIKTDRNEEYVAMLIMGANKNYWGLINQNYIMNSLANMAETNNISADLYRHCRKFVEDKAEHEGIEYSEASFSMKEFENILYQYERGEL